MAVIDFGSWDKVNPVLCGGYRTWVNHKGIFAGRDCRIVKRDGTHWVYVDNAVVGSRFSIKDAKNLATDTVCGK